jgi:hypothetical protein
MAPKLGISRHTADQRLRNAMRKLGAANRDEAALMLQAAEQGAPYQRLIYQSPHIEAAASNSDESPTSGEDRRSAEMGADRPQGRRYTHATRRDIPRKGRVLDDLGLFSRLGLILMVAIGVTLGFGTFLAGLEALAKLTERPPHHS